MTGEEEVFEGKLFDPVVFDDSVGEFLRVKEKLADYFSEENKEDTVIKHNFRQIDVLQYAKDGTLEQKLSEIYGG